MGLDYHRNLARRNNQRRCFTDQLAIAKTVQKPVFLHEVARCRDEDPAALAAQTLANTRRFFGVS